MQMNFASFGVSFALSSTVPQGSMTSRVTEMRTRSEHARRATAPKRVSGRMTERSTDEPSRPKRAGCARPQSQLMVACTGVRSAADQTRPAVQPRTMVARTPPPERSSILPPETQRKEKPTAAIEVVVGERERETGMATSMPHRTPTATPARSSSGALSSVIATDCAPSPCWTASLTKAMWSCRFESSRRMTEGMEPSFATSGSARARQMPNPAIASTSSNEAAAMTIDGTPFLVPSRRVCMSSMPGTTTAGETAAMTKPRRPPHAGGSPSSGPASSATVAASARHGPQARRAVTAPIVLSLSRSSPSPARSMMIERAQERSVSDHHSKVCPSSGSCPVR
mmetsp:Transcript_14066/g.45391  ORF Transcript_14066/g.45391 Transcript_14066/m.45391 type:complete len:340 (-) Transcript_14066:420-1439(-)